MSPMPSIPHEEYTKRYLTEIRGSTSIVDDVSGEHLDYRRITMEEFLGKQLANRINFKYGRSDFPPSEDTVSEILNIVSTTVRLYEFEAFENIVLKDLDTDEQKTLSRSELTNYESEIPKEGKFHVIKFF